MCKAWLRCRNKMADAAARWRMLAKVIRKDLRVEEVERNISVRRFSGFQLLETKKVEFATERDGNYQWLEYTSPLVEKLDVMIR